MRWIARRNAIFADPRFQRWAARMPLLRRVARRKSRELFDLVAGFTYTQTLLAALESGLLDRLAQGATTGQDAGSATGLNAAATDRLLRASAAIGLAEQVAPDLWMLGERGAALMPQEGAKAMIRHHALLYRDLADPLALLRDDRAGPTELSRFWCYADNASPGSEPADSVTPYSHLMAASQAMVAEQVLDAVDLGQWDSLLDIGGGHGVFLEAVGRASPKMQRGLFDLPGVVEKVDLPGVQLHSGDFFHDPLPTGYAAISLVRILHDHDDEPAQALLASIRAALPPGGTLLIAEPMAQTAGAEAMGDAYFGLYLWAMRSGRPRSANEILTMLDRAGFARASTVSTDQPIIASVIVAIA